MIIRDKNNGRVIAAHIRVLDYDPCDAVVVDEDDNLLDLHGCEIVEISDDERNLMPEYAYIEMEEL